MKLLKRFSLLLVICSLIFGLSHTLVVEAAGKVSNGSTIAGVPLENLTNDEAKILLQEHVTNWLNGEVLIVESEYETFEIPRSVFVFDIDGSLKELEEKTKRTWSSFFMKKKNVQIPLKVDVKEENLGVWPENIDIDQTISKASIIASNLGEGNVEIVYLEDSTAVYEEVARVSFTIPSISTTVTGHLSDQLDGFTITPNSPFSFLESVKLLDGMANSEAEMSFVATGLYDLVLQTNLEIVERSSLGVIPSYTNAGIEVSVNKEDGVDFLLFNPSEVPYTIRAEVNENELMMAIESVPERTYGYLIENEVEIEPKTIYRYSSDLAYGEEEVIQNGKEGLQVEVYRTTEHLDGSIDRERIGREYYPPTPEIVVVSTTQETELSTDEMLDSQLEGVGLPENTDLYDLLNGENSDGTDDSQSTDNSFNTETLLLNCLLKNNSDIENTESEELENVVEESLDICDLLILYLLSSMADGGTMNELDKDGVESGLSLEELLKNNNLLNLPEEDKSEIDEEVILK